MNYVLDSHLLVWALSQTQKLPARARTLLTDPGNSFHFSAASIWELSIKSVKRPDIFSFDVDALRSAALEDGFKELSVTSSHGLATKRLPSLHGDPFDRILIAQALVEGMVLATIDEDILRYSAPILDVS